MKKALLLFVALTAGVLMAAARTLETGDCDCPSCAAKTEGSFTLPGLEGLNNPPAQEEVDHDEHEGHDHAAAPVAHDHAAAPVAHDHDGDGVSDHAVHEEVDEHAGHDHGAVEGVTFTRETLDKVGIQVREAAGGTVAKSAVLPAEIKLNGDTTVAVSPRYASIVRQVFAEIGDEVRKGDPLAALENRETMAVYTVYAPRDGVIISKDCALGEAATVEKALFEVADLSTVWADISVFPRYQHLLRKGAPVSFVAHDGHTATGAIKYISPIIDHQTRTFTARCVLVGADEDFTPGAFVRARVEVERANAPVVVPLEAVQTLEGERVVFVPSPNGFVSAVVEEGLADERNVEIVGGLAPGAKYVAVGAFALKAQMVVGGMDPHAGHGH